MTLLDVAVGPIIFIFGLGLILLIAFVAFVTYFSIKALRKIKKDVNNARDKEIDK